MNEIIKNKIKSCFNKSANNYDELGVLQKKICLELIRSVSCLAQDYNHIADFACGTGFGIEYIIKMFNYKKVYAVDFSDKLLSIATNKFFSKQVEFMLADFDKPLFKKNHLDLVFCNMGLQWSLNLSNTLNLLHSYLIHSGKLAFSMPLQGTFCELKSEYRNTFYNELDIEHILRLAGFTIETIKKTVYVEHFQNQLDAIRSIKAIGANCSLNINKKEAPTLRKQVKHFFISPIDTTLTYHIGIFVAKK